VILDHGIRIGSFCPLQLSGMPIVVRNPFDVPVCPEWSVEGSAHLLCGASRCFSYDVYAPMAMGTSRAVPFLPTACLGGRKWLEAGGSNGDGGGGASKGHI